MNETIRGRLDAAAVEQAIAELAAAFGDRLVTSQAVREQHGNTTTWIAAVIYPQSADDVQLAVRTFARYRVPVSRSIFGEKFPAKFLRDAVRFFALRR
jgi:D-lactate dehydrogenase (cytochrome)